MHALAIKPRIIQILITELNPLFSRGTRCRYSQLFYKLIDRILYGLGGVGNQHEMLGEDENKLVTSRRKKFTTS